MKLRDWRQHHGLSLAEVASGCGIAGVNPRRQLQRFETGEREASASVVEMIRIGTGDAVQPSDMHEIRITWLREHGLLPELPKRSILPSDEEHAA